MPLWTTLYLGEDRRRGLLNTTGSPTTSWGEVERARVHSHIVALLRATVVGSLREFTGETDEKEEQVLLLACFACDQGPGSIVNQKLKQVPQRAALAQLKEVLGEAGYHDALLLGEDLLYQQILGAILLEDENLRRFVNSRLPVPLV